MQLYTSFEYNKLHLKEVTILMPKHHPNINSFLTPLLGLYGINVKEFVADFESKTKFIEFDAILPIRVKISKIKTFEIALKTPYISELIANTVNLTLLQLYKIALIKSTHLNIRSYSFNEKFYSNVRRYLKIKTFPIAQPIIKTTNTSRSINRIVSINSDFSRFNNQNSGILINFNNNSGRYLNHLRTTLKNYNINIIKLNKHFKSHFNNIAVGLCFYIASSNFDSINNIFKYFIKRKNTSNLFLTSYIINNNVVSKIFLRSISIEYTLFSKKHIFKSINGILKFMLLLSKIILKPIFISNYYANISPNTFQS